MKRVFTIPINMLIIAGILGGCNSSQEASTAIPIPTNTTSPTSPSTEIPSKAPEPTFTTPPTETLVPKSTESPLIDDPFVKTWDIECFPEGCLLFLDIAHGSSE
ncbi:MAG: hypothetical protein IIC78_07370 [Chloroflexi bacterium]|nr:hypothetical protein [Chloroflexota bacterium]